MVMFFKGPSYCIYCGVIVNFENVSIADLKTRNEMIKMLITYKIKKIHFKMS